MKKIYGADYGQEVIIRGVKYGYFGKSIYSCSSGKFYVFELETSDGEPYWLELSEEDGEVYMYMYKQITLNEFNDKLKSDFYGTSELKDKARVTYTERGADVEVGDVVIFKEYELDDESEILSREDWGYGEVECSIGTRIYEQDIIMGEKNVYRRKKVSYTESSSETTSSVVGVLMLMFIGFFVFASGSPKNCKQDNCSKRNIASCCSTGLYCSVTGDLCSSMTSSNNSYYRSNGIRSARSRYYSSSGGGTSFGK